MIPEEATTISQAKMEVGHSPGTVETMRNDRLF